MGGRIDEKGLEQCLREKIAPSAVQSLFAILERSKKDNLVSRYDSVPELDGTQPFRVEMAAAGPKNANGKSGKVGKLNR